MSGGSGGAPRHKSFTLSAYRAAMVYARAFLLVLALLGFYLLGAPLQLLARRRNWPLAQKIPPFFCQTICALLGLRIHWENRGLGEIQGVGESGGLGEGEGLGEGVALGDKPRMIVANHVSWSDILVLASRETPCFVAKSEVAGWPLLGAFAKVQNTIFVQRGNRNDVPRVNAAMAERMMQGEDVLLFGEGTSSDGEGVLTFKPSHFGAARDLLQLYPKVKAVTIQPAAIAYLRSKGRRLDAAGRRELAWFGDAELAPHIWKLLKAAPVDCHVRFGAPLAFDAAADRKAVAQQTEARVRELAKSFNRPCD